MVEGNGRDKEKWNQERSRQRKGEAEQGVPGRLELTAWARLWVLCCRGEGALERPLLPVLPSANRTPASQDVRGRATWLPFAWNCAVSWTHLATFSGPVQRRSELACHCCLLMDYREESTERHIWTELGQGWREPRHRWQHCRREHHLGLLTVRVPALLILLPTVQLEHILGAKGQSNIYISVHTPRRETEVCVHPPSSGQGTSLVLRVP